MRNAVCFVLLLCLASCKKGSDKPPPVTPPQPIILVAASVDGQSAGALQTGVRLSPIIRLAFDNKVDRNTVAPAINFTAANALAVNYTIAYIAADSTIQLQPSAPLTALTKYQITVGTSLKSTAGGTLNNASSFGFTTGIDSSDKFSIISDSALVQLTQQQTFKYFWDFAHPVSGLARERNTSGETVTSGGSGFGLMAILVGIQRGFITRTQGLTRLQTIVSFLKNTAQKFHGAFPHWLNGTTGAVIPFSAKDDGADLVETSFLMQGLLCARQYFNGSDAAETSLRADVNSIWQGVEWNWFRQNNQAVLYWHWSPNYAWDMNVQIKGWNEALITYVLAASSPTYSVPKIVYDNGWASNGGMKNGNSFYNYVLPLGPDKGGPLFFEHYSFLGINPFGLTDAYANYQTQTINHTKINYEYCKANPKGWYGYSDQVWGLTASDIANGYTASSPTNDVGVIAPTAALSSFPYTQTESMKALKFFYYKLGDKLWSNYGFKDAFNLNQPWFADSYLAIDEGPIVVMIENYRSGLLWNLFMSCPEVKTGMKNLGFQSPYL
ncbi:glucoamylase family protein [Flavisolibacter ginsenosidimutans]|uniref:Beta-glucosidase n=2 Tax=Flavisolibacter ginsenosidimutans TaxID=661481 RepID=A0A5B8URG8_9BACT|nr:beta-glucosidase [Flavisolibacter ginsenosidimutans]